MSPRRSSCLAVLLTSALAACASTHDETLAEDELRAGSVTLASIGEQYLKLVMNDDPVFATSIGHHEYDGKLYDRSPEAVRAWREGITNLSSQLRSLRRDRLPERDRLSFDLLKANVDVAARVSAACDNLSPFVRESTMANLGSDLDAIASGQVLTSEADVASFLTRAAKMPTLIAQTEANLRSGLARNVLLPRATVDALLKGYKTLVALPSDQWVIVTSMTFGDGLSANARTEAQRKTAALVDDKLRPSFARYVEFLEGTYAPRARATVGLAALPEGAKCYDALIEFHTDTKLTASEIHDLGMAELQGIQREWWRSAPRPTAPKTWPSSWSA
ncbi:MAG: DUF885 family protein [Myxococcales bacterium]|nr:DUF885 family protein [Myxococcales bacterium]